jgi:hypothetical protein
LAQLLAYAVHLPEEVERRPVSGLPPELPVSEKVVHERIEWIHASPSRFDRGCALVQNRSRSLGPPELAALEPLVNEPSAVPIPKQQLPSFPRWLGRFKNTKM